MADVRGAGVLGKLVAHCIGIGMVFTLAAKAGEETGLATCTSAQGVVVGGRWAVALLFLAVADQEDFHEGGEDEDTKKSVQG